MDGNVCNWFMVICRDLGVVCGSLRYFNAPAKDTPCHPQKWSTDLPGYRIGIPIGIALRKQWTDIAIVISCSFYTIKSLNK